MPQYRIYHLDGVGRVSTAEWLEAADDDAAARTAASRKTIQWEVWRDRRLVARARPQPAAAAERTSLGGAALPGM